MISTRGLLLPFVIMALALGGCSVPTTNWHVAAPAEDSTPVALRSNYRWQADTNQQEFIRPRNGRGIIMNSAFRTGNEMDSCGNGDNLRFSRTVPEVLHYRYLLFSEQDGPLDIGDYGAPWGYSQTPAGAALAAFNARSLYSGADYFAYKNSAEIIDFGSPESKEFPPGERSPDRLWPPMNPPVAISVTDCTANSATVRLLIDRFKDDKYLLITSPVEYRDGTWLITQSPQEYDSAEVETSGDNVDWDEWTQVAYQDAPEEPERPSSKYYFLPQRDAMPDKELGQQWQNWRDKTERSQQQRREEIERESRSADPALIHFSFS